MGQYLWQVTVVTPPDDVVLSQRPDEIRPQVFVDVKEAEDGLAGASVMEEG